MVQQQSAKRELFFIQGPPLEAQSSKDDLPVKERHPVQTRPVENETTILNQLTVSNLKASMPEVISYFVQKTECFTAGQLSYRLNEWRKLTSDSEVLNTVCGETIEFTSLPLHNGAYKEKQFSKSENTVIAQEIQKLLSKGVIAKSLH